MRAFFLNCILSIVVLSLSACEMTTSAFKSSFSNVANDTVSTQQSNLLNATTKSGSNLGTF